MIYDHISKTGQLVLIHIFDISQPTVEDIFTDLAMDIDEEIEELLE